MRVDAEAAENRGVLEYLSDGGKHRSPVLAGPSALAKSRERFGSHPDIVQYLWDEIAPRLHTDTRAVVYGTPALVAPERGLVFAVALGTEYGLRLPPSEFAQARAAGAEVVHTYRTVGVTLDLAERFGPGWVFGTFDKREPDWFAAALEFAEAAG
jgi:hypothetical protein